MIDHAVGKFSDKKKANPYFIKELVSSWKQRSEYLFENDDEYLEFIYLFHYIFKHWEGQLEELYKPTHRYIMASFLMKVYHFHCLLEKNVFLNVCSPVEALRKYQNNLAF